MNQPRRLPPYGKQARAYIAAGNPILEIWIFHGPEAFDRASRRPGGLALPPDTDPDALDWSLTAGREVLIVPAPRTRLHPDRNGNAVLLPDPVPTLSSDIERAALACLEAGARVVRSIEADELIIYRQEELLHEVA